MFRFKLLTVLALVGIFHFHQLEAKPGRRLRPGFDQASSTEGYEISSPSYNFREVSHSQAPLYRLRTRPTRRSSTTPIPIPPSSEPPTPSRSSPIRTTTTSSSSQPLPAESHNSRKEIIEKLCKRKYGLPTTTTTIPQRKTPLPIVEESEPQRTVHRRFRPRVSRQVKKLPRPGLRRTSTSTSTSTESPQEKQIPTTPLSSTTSLPSQFLRADTTNTTCKDFDHFTDEQLAKRLKNGGRRKPKPQTK